ncbi:hypothetical protein [Kribbella sp. DT2]|uniref:hypothetical protein n=1 Tax=Kribbella sp. DT2 TaxID=3393427 RepID=UPI003CF7E94E
MTMRRRIGFGEHAVRTGAVVAVLALVAACGNQRELGGTPPTAESTPPPSVPVEAGPPPGDDVTLSLPPTDQAVVTRGGTTPVTTVISGRYGPEYQLYARCRGPVELKVTGLPNGQWVAPCDGVPSRVTVLTESPAVSLRLTVPAGATWSFVVARSKAASAG